MACVPGRVALKPGEPAMPSNTLAYRSTICLIWALALWHSWICRGLFVDGSAFVLSIVKYEWFFYFYPPRMYAMIASQIPIMAAVILGVTDLHLLSRLLSLGLFGLPTLLYTFALVRARHDAVLLAGVIAVIGMVFLPTSFFIVGEYNTIYALAMLVAVRLATAERLRLGDSIVLAALAAFSLRVYEAMLYLGPLLSAMTLWRAWRAPARPLVPLVLHLAAAALFVAACAIAVDAVVQPFSPLVELHLGETLQQAKLFWQNMQFDMVFAATLIVVVWALVRPADLATARPYRWAALALVLLMLSPLLALGGTLVRPLAKSQYISRTMGGLVVAGVIAFLWLYVSDMHNRLKALIVLRRSGAARRLLVFACLMPVAMLPSDIFLSRTWVAYLDDMRGTVTSHGGLIAFEDTPLSRWPDVLLVEEWVLPSQSLVLRSKETDGIVLPPRSYDEWLPFPPLEPPNLGRFFWRD